MKTDPNIQPVKIIPSEIPSGQVAVRKTAYHYGRQGQVTLAHDRTHIVPEHEAIRFMSGLVSVTWPDGYSEHFDFRVTPAQASGTFGTIPGVNLNCGVQGQVHLSRLPNMAVAYYSPVEITQEQRESFVPYVWND